MKVHLSLVKKFLDLPDLSEKEVRLLCNDDGLEVKDINQGSTGPILTIETLANRGDHLCALGVARELSARLLLPLAQVKLASALPERPLSLGLSVETPLCSRYSAVEFQLQSDFPLVADIANVLPDPNPEKATIVHLTNYILAEIGQPLHAFDRDKLVGKLQVVELAAPESIEALDGKTYTVPAGAIVIRDAEKIVAVGGIIGCANSMVTKESKRAVVEAATFDPVRVRITARAMGIATEASDRFQRGADIDLPPIALRRMMLLLEGGAQASGAAHYTARLAEPRVIKVSVETIRNEFNLPRLDAGEIIARLSHLGFLVKSEGEKKAQELSVTVPSWRIWDVVNPEDVVEEVIKAKSLQAVKQSLPLIDHTEKTAQKEDPLHAVLEKIEPILLGQGCYEVVTRSSYSVQEKELLERLLATNKPSHVAIVNALYSNDGYLRVSLLPSLVKLAAYNESHGLKSIRFFEFARIFSAEKGSLSNQFDHERNSLGILLAGQAIAGSWKGAVDSNSIASLVGELRGLVEAIGQSLALEFTIAPSEDGLLHPGIQGAIRVGKTTVGSFGAVHPELLAHFGCKLPAVFAEFDPILLQQKLAERVFVSPCDQPIVQRDLTIMVPAKVFASKVVQVVEATKTIDLKSCSIVDSFQRQGETFRRITYRLTFQNGSRTLRSEEVESAVSAIIKELADRSFPLAV